MLRLVSAVMLTIILSVPSLSKVVYVKTDGVDTNDGLSWTTAKKTISAGLALAVSGDEVWVAKGTYPGTTTLKAGVALYGGYSGEGSVRDPAVFETVLDNRFGFYGAVIAPGGAQASTEFDGFTVRSYYAVTCDNNASPKITRNKFTGSSPYAIYCSNGSSPQILFNVFTECRGSAIECNNQSSPTVVGNTISTCGSGVNCRMASNPVIRGNVIARCGGAVYCYQSSPLICNNTIIVNKATSPIYQGGSIICCIDSSPTVFNNIVANNVGGIYCSGSGVPVLRNNCVYNPDGYNYSGLSAGVGDISTDPMLAFAEYGQIHLLANSPCIDAGDDSVVEDDWLDMDGRPRKTDGDSDGEATVDMGADEYDGTIYSYTPVVVRVSPQGDDANDGSSWALAKKTVQAAIDAASSQGGEVWVAAGIYHERITLNTFVYVYGGFSGDETAKDERDWRVNETILDGDAAGTVVMAASIGYRTSTIDGFTIRNGKGTYSGGVFCNCASPTISNNVIIGNIATATQGIRGGGVTCWFSSPVLASNRITSNTVTPAGGGGVASNNASPILRDNVISDNIGHGIYWYAETNSVATHNTITHNSSSGVYCAESSPLVSHNDISGNGYTGVGCSDASPTILANTIVGNISSGVSASWDMPQVLDNLIALNGMGISFSEAYGTIIGNTVVANGGSQGIGILSRPSVHSPSTHISSNIIAFHAIGVRRDTQYLTYYSPELLEYNDVYNPDGVNYDNLPAGITDISADPLLSDKEAGNYHLSALSPCINAGSSDVLGSRTLDIDGQPRIWAGTIDIGADEFQAAFANPGQVKLLPAGSWTGIDSLPVSAAETGMFYVEAEDRSSGIRVEKTDHGLQQDWKADVAGKVKVNTDGECFIEAVTADRSGIDVSPVAPLFLNNRTIGGGQLGLQDSVWSLSTPASGLNNIGLLVKTCGRVTYAEPTFFYVDDGSDLDDGSGHPGVKVYGVVSVPQGENPLDRFVSVTGISSCEKPGTNLIRVIRTRSTDDVQVIQ